jgi:hypothetical protein
MTLRGWAAIGGIGACALLLGWWQFGRESTSAKAPSKALSGEEAALPSLAQSETSPGSRYVERARPSSRILASAVNGKPQRPSLAKGQLPALRRSAPNRAAASSPVVARKLAARSGMADTLNARLTRRIDRLTILRDQAVGAEQARLSQQIAALSANQVERQRWADGLLPQRPLKK